MNMLTDNNQRYGVISQILHWGLAALTIAAYLTGESLVAAVEGGKAAVMFWHASLSILVVGLFVVRAAWRISQSSPVELNRNKLLVVAHKVVVLALYALPVVLTLTGAVSILANGQAVGFFALNFLPGWTVVDTQLSAWLETAHVYLAHALISIFVVHTLAALWHQFVQRDGTLMRMLPFRLNKS